MVGNLNPYHGKKIKRIYGKSFKLVIIRTLSFSKDEDKLMIGAKEDF
jgi:hypothetical protein